MRRRSPFWRGPSPEPLAVGECLKIGRSRWAPWPDWASRTWLVAPGVRLRAGLWCLLDVCFLALVSPFLCLGYAWSVVVQLVVEDWQLSWLLMPWPLRGSFGPWVTTAIGLWGPGAALWQYSWGSSLALPGAPAPLFTAYGPRCVVVGRHALLTSACDRACAMCQKGSLFFQGH